VFDFPRPNAQGLTPTGGPGHTALFLAVWLGPPVILMAFIFWLGTDRASADVTRGFLGGLIEALLPGRFSPEALEPVNFVVRKAGHFSGYALLGVLDARALRGLRERSGARNPPAAAPWAAATLWAAVDEFHQSFSASRGASPWDVALDSAGAAVGILIYSLWKSRRTPLA
jgi:VanZ family protein